MEEPERRARCEQSRKEPAPYPSPHPEMLAGLGSLNRNARALQQEIGCRQPISSAGRQRDHQVVNQSGSNEHQKPRAPRSQPPVQRTEDQLVPKLAESEIPTPSPELTERCRTERCR